MIKQILIVASEIDLDFKYFDNPETYIIGVERGSLSLIKNRIKIDYAISDFDKVDNDELELIKNYAQQTEILLPEKFYLDGEQAILKAKEIDSQAKIFFVVNPTKRFDKAFSIFSLIFKYDITMLNNDSVLFLIKKGITKLDFDNYQNKTYISFFAKTQTKISLENIKYPLNNSTLDAFDNGCISNAFIPYQNPIITVDNDIICVMTT